MAAGSTVLTCQAVPPLVDGAVIERTSTTLGSRIRTAPPENGTGVEDSTAHLEDVRETLARDVVAEEASRRAPMQATAGRTSRRRAGCDSCDAAQGRCEIAIPYSFAAALIRRQAASRS